MAMQFRTWLEDEASLNSGFPELGPNVNRGAATVASDEVLRTGLQPQVDSKEIHTDQKDEQDKILAIDGAIKRADSEIPQGKQEGSEKLSRFKQMWDKLKEKWEDLKMMKPDDDNQPDTNGLGSVKGDEKMMAMMQRQPNAMPSNTNQLPSGPSMS